MQKYRFQKHIIIQNIIIVVVVIVLLTTAAFGYICWNYIQSYQEQQEFQLSGINSQIDTTLGLADEIALQLAANQVVIESFKKVEKYEGSSNYFVNDTDLDYQLKQYMMSYMLKKNSIARICLFDDRQNFTFAGSMVDYGYLQKNCPDQEYFSEIAEYFSSGTDARMFRIDSKDPYVKDGSTVVSMIREIKDYDLLPSKRLGYVQVQIPIENFSKFCEGLGSEQEFLLFYDGGLMFSYNGEKDQNQICRSIERLRNNPFKNIFYSDVYMEEFDITLAVFSQNIRLLNSVITVFIWLALLVVCVISIIWMGQMKVIRKTTEPIVRLCDMVESLKADENLKEIPLIAEEGDELRTLNKAFDSVVRNLKLSMEKMMVSQVNEIRSQMLALQAQMNPHFIHNILTIISAMSDTDERKKIPEICGKLSDMIRYNTDYEDNYTDLEREMDYAENYLELMKLRYEDNLTYYMTYAGRMKECKVPKFVVQPLIENCFLHGFVKKEFPWNVEVQAFVTGHLWECTIFDNGGGIDEQKLSEINEELKKCREQKVSDLMSELKIGGLTIRNIYVRLYMAYGSEMIFQIDSGKDGTCIRIGGTCDD